MTRDEAIDKSPIGKLCYVCEVYGCGPTPATHEGCEHLATDLVPQDRAQYGLCDECHNAGPCPECEAEGSN